MYLHILPSHNNLLTTPSLLPSPLLSAYLQNIGNLYGADDSPRSVIGTHLPILISTVLIALGWVITLTPIETPGAVQTLFHPQEKAISRAPRRRARWPASDEGARISAAQYKTCARPTHPLTGEA